MAFSALKIPSWAFGEKLTSAQMNQLNGYIPNAMDAVGGGFYALTANLLWTSLSASGIAIAISPDVLNFAPISSFTIYSPSLGAHATLSGDWDLASGSTLTWKGTTVWPRVDVRSIHYEQPLLNLAKNDSSRFLVGPATGGAGTTPPSLTQQNITDGGSVWIPLTNIPRRGTITSFGMSIDGNGGGSSHSNVPAFSHLPKISLNQFSSSGALVSTTTVEDAPANLAAYEVLHDVTGTQTYTLDGTSTLYLVINGEDGPDAVANALRVYRVFVVVNVTEIGA